jgi:hypothetical protein
MSPFSWEEGERLERKQQDFLWTRIDSISSSATRRTLEEAINSYVFHQIVGWIWSSALQASLGVIVSSKQVSVERRIGAAGLNSSNTNIVGK